MLSLYSIWIDSFILFCQTLQMFHCLLPISDEKSAIVLIFVTLYVVYLFSLSTFKTFLSIFGFQWMTIMCVCVIFFLSTLLEVHWGFWILCFSLNLGRFWSLFLPYLSASLCETQIRYMWNCLILSHSHYSFVILVSPVFFLSAFQCG